MFTNVVGVAGKRTGNKATCTLNVPYEWYLGTPAQDTVAMDLEVVATVGTLGTSGFYEEAYNSPAVTMKVPANGTTTTENITTTI